MASRPHGTPLVYLHIPKAAGSTLNMILGHHYPKRAYDSGINAFQRLELAGPLLEDAASRKKLRALSAEVTFGLAHRYLPDARYVTILREPVARVLSQFGYFKAGFGAGLIPSWLPKPPADITLAQAIADGGYIPDNLQTRMLCGLVSPFDPLPPDALEQAKRNLAERFAFVGTSERFDEFLAVLNLELDWPTLPYRSRNVNRGSIDQPVPDDDLRLVAERNVLDSELHAVAGDLLGQAVRQAGAGLQMELDVLREALRRIGTASAGTVRSLPVEARVALALKERDLAAAQVRIKRLSGLLNAERPRSLAARIRARLPGRR